MWTSFPDKIFLINLDRRTDRLATATEQLNRYNIPFERVPAIEDSNGAKGLFDTMEVIFRKSILNNWKNVLLLEDDIDIIFEGINEIMDQVVATLPSNYDILYLGGQLCRIPETWYNKNLFPVKSFYSTHAAMYSLQGMKKFLERAPFYPVDNYICLGIQPDNNCYATYPMLISQTVTKSDIYTAEPAFDWKKYLEVKYAQQIQRMQELNLMHPEAINYYGQ